MHAGFPARANYVTWGYDLLNSLSIGPIASDEAKNVYDYLLTVLYNWRANQSRGWRSPQQFLLQPGVPPMMPAPLDQHYQILRRYRIVREIRCIRPRNVRRVAKNGVLVAAASN